jgi:hypothetical protein
VHLKIFRDLWKGYRDLKVKLSVLQSRLFLSECDNTNLTKEFRRCF